jgi:Ca2+-binding RTX toxin-like protein
MLRKIVRRCTGSKSRPASRKTRRRLATERLAERRMMAADISIDTRGVLTVEGANDPELIQVSTGYQYRSIGGRRIPIASVFVDVQNLQNFQVQREVFSPSNVMKINIEANGGHDIIDLRGYSIPSYIAQPRITVDGGVGSDTVYGSELDETIRGGRFSDTIYGNGGDDTIFGDESDDTIYGGSGDDVIHGGADQDTIYGDSGKDRIYGNSGNDIIRGGSNHDDLFGGSGIDFIYGNSGNDRIFGGTHDDYMYGDSGHDSMFGGSGRDWYTGGTGNDRFLKSAVDSYRFLDRRSWDATITFEDTSGNFNNQGVTYYAGSWSESDINQVDKAMQLMVNVTQNNSLLRGRNGSDVTLLRRGGDNDRTSFVWGWNDGTRITITSNAFVFDPRLAAGNNVNPAVVHEFAHFWDETHENPFVQQFRDTVGWRQIASWDFWTSRNGLTHSDGKNDWWFRTAESDQFAREYGKTNPKEDFATAMTAYVMTKNNIRYELAEPTESVQETRSRMSERFAILDSFFATL